MMKFRLFIPFVAALLLVSCGGRGSNRNTAERGEGGYIHVVELDAIRAAGIHGDTVSLGNIRSGEVIEYRLGVKNTDSVSFIILNMTTTCGCATMDYDKQPIKPGETATITVQYNSRGQSGFQWKPIHFITSLNSKPYPVYLTAEVSN